MLGVRGSLDEQLEFVRDCMEPYKDKLASREILQSALRRNGSDQGYGEIEAEFLYCFVRRHRPGTIVQIGCGVSTAVCLLASNDEGYKPRIICIEPYPTQFLKEAHASGDLELVEKKAQNVDLELFRQVGPGDLFFVDSSHTLGPGGEVSRIVLSILPRIAADAFVHFHDIVFPYDYSPSVLSSDLFFGHETALVYAFLCMNERYKIAASLSQLFHDRRNELQHFFPQMKPAEFRDGLMLQPGHYPSLLLLRA